LPSQASLSLSWKQEVNERIAAHKSRRPAGEAMPLPQSHHANRRAAAAAARVAARFANAPSYGDLLVDGALAAARAAEAASRAAQEAQAAAETMLAGLEAHRAAEVPYETPAPRARFASEVEELEPSAPAPRSQPVHQQQSADPADYRVRWSPDLPTLKTESVDAPAELDAWAEMDAWRQNLPSPESADAADAVKMVDAIQPIPANLIEFPREIVAPRKVRPRLVEGAYVDSVAEPQLSIFEVDPRTVSTEPAPAEPVSAAQTSSIWTAPQWSGIKLDAQPRTEYVEAPLLPGRNEVAIDPITGPSSDPAPMSLRSMAIVVDMAFALAAFLAVVMLSINHLPVLPTLRSAEIAFAAGLLIAAALYTTLFYTLTSTTPGMWFAGITLSTLDGHEPDRSQRLGRLVALLVSVLPVGLGLVWSIFDEDRLCWHDRLSRTYLRRK
jgi:uncharacterized RDD family membrane protein YckC